MKKDKKLIPKGNYCYTYVKGKGKQVNCPFWSTRKGKPMQSNGYCSYLEKGDWEFNKEKNSRNINKKTGKAYGPKFSGNDLGIPISLLWDQVKMCRISEII